MLHVRVVYRGEFIVNRDPGIVFRFLSDPRIFARVFPGFQDVKIMGGEEFIVKLKVTIGPFRGDATLRGRFIELVENKLVKVAGRWEGAGSTMDYMLTFALAKVNSETRVDWVFEGYIEGLAALLGDKVLNSIARSLIDEITEGIIGEVSKL